MNSGLTKDMTQHPPMGLILKFTLPMLIGNLFQQFYNMVDSAVVGRFVSKDALAAVGATGSLLFLILGLTFGLSAGVSIVISQYFGAKDYDNVRKSFATSAYIIAGASVIMGTVGFFGARSLLKITNTPDTIIGQSEAYMKIFFAGMLGTGMYNGMSAVLRALGNSLTPLVFLIIASVLNVVLDLVFVILFNMGVPGVAIATVISQVLSGIACIIYAMAKVKILRMPVREFKLDKTIFKKCIRLGIPVALQNSFISVSMMALQGVINSFNEVIIAAVTITNRLEQLVFQPCMSLGMALASFTGQNIGAGLHDRVKKGIKSAFLLILAFSLIMLPVMYFGGEYFMRLFTKAEDFEVVRYGVEGIRITSFFHLFVGIIFITRNFLSGAGDINFPMVMGFAEVICRVLFSNIISRQIGFKGIYWATVLTWLLTGLLGVLRILSGRWKNKAVTGTNT
jgi:putative MATE family efflux protein